MYVKNAITTLLQHRDIKKSSHSELKTACEEALKALQDADPLTNGIANGVDGEAGSSQKSISSILPEPNPSFVNVGKFFLPFELACQSKTPKIVCTALDSIEKLVAYGHISHEYFDDNKNAEALLFDDHLTSTVANCFSGPQTDEGVQVQILKALLSIVTSGHIRVHGNSLLLAVRTCYNIYLASRNLNYQATAKATLSQIINCVSTRMEEACKAVADEKAILERQKEEIDAATAPAGVTVRFGTDDDDAAREEDSIVYPVLMGIVDAAVREAVKKEVQSPTLASLEQEANLLQKDTFLVFRSLCKLSMKPLPDGYPDPKSHELRSKILSLQLLLGILQNGDEAFCNNEICVSAIKSYLCVALSQNGVSSISEVFELCLALFIELLTKYKRHLKSQIEIFFKEICLNILEATTSSFEQKWLVIEGIGKICNDAQMVVDIYVNYDCDLSAANIFERLIDVLSKIAQGRQAFELGASSSQLKAIRMKGLECLVSILKCMVEWSKDLYVNPHALPHNSLSTFMSKPDLAAEGGASDAEDAHSVASADDDPSQFEKVKQYKHVLEHGFKLFKQKPNKGVRYMVEQGVIEDSMAATAKFLHSECHRLDKTAVGEYLGELENKEVMYHYVDEMNYVDMNFVEALRHFLEGFRLPGEAQKIDRLMEKFASRYFECNPNQGLFASADTAYVLAYSIIMLTTDLHSSRVKKKMTKEEFIKNNRGINDSEDLPNDYLSKIYDEIASSEIKLKATGASVDKTLVVTDHKKRQQIWCQERDNITKAAEALMVSASGSSDTFMTAKRLEHVKPMFKIVWSPVLAVFSVGLQDSNDAGNSQLCLEGIQCAIRIACIFGFTLERDAFLQALARFTLLTYNSNVTEIKSKNIDTIKALISVAYTDGNYLGESWVDVMKCISQLEVAQNISSGLGRTDKASSQMSASFIAKQIPLSVVSGESTIEQHFRESINEASSQSILVAVDRIFTGSRNLNADAIVHFARALCVVSKDETSSGQSHPRMFCLNKLVEISYYNMERIRLEWSRIWQVLGAHFNMVGCNDSQHVSIFAVDSLKQLSMKFLEKGELQNFHFQKDFLRPFEFIMKNNKSRDIRDMVVRCISQMVQSQAANIKSGWKNIFATYALAASDSDENIIAMSFQSTVQIVNDFLALEKFCIVDSFQDCVKCLSEFGCNHLIPDIAMEAIRLIRKCAKYVSEHRAQFVDSGHESGGGGGGESKAGTDDDRVWIRGWFPVLFELSCIINSSKLDIRTRSLTILFDVVKQYGHLFVSNWWLDLFRVLFRIFDIVKNDGRDVSVHKEWMDTTCNHALYAMTDVFNEFFDHLSPILLKDLLDKFRWCAQQENDQLSKSAVSCLENLVLTNRPEMDLDTEHTVLSFLSDILVGTLIPSATRFELPEGVTARIPQTLTAKSAKQRISTQLEIVASIRRMIFGVSMKEVSKEHRSIVSNDCFRDVLVLVDCLMVSHNAARSYLAEKDQSSPSTVLVPLVVKQETESLKCAVEILLELYQDKSLPDYQDTTEAKLLSVLADVLSYFLGIESKSQQESWTGLLCLVFEQLLDLPDAKFRITVPVLYVHICDIMSVQISPELRETLCKILKRIGTVYGIVPAEKP